MSQLMSFKLWVRAPRMTIASFDELNEKTPGRRINSGGATDASVRLRAQPAILHYKTRHFAVSPQLRAEKLLAGFTSLSRPNQKEEVARHLPAQLSVLTNPGFPFLP